MYEPLPFIKTISGRVSCTTISLFFFILTLTSCQIELINKICEIACTNLWHLWNDKAFRLSPWYHKTWYLVACFVPITDEKIELGFRFREWNADGFVVVDSNRAKPSSGFLEVDWRKVEESANLILHLEHVGPVLTWFDRVICARNSVLPGVQSLLYTIPVPTNLTTKTKFQSQKCYLKHRGC